MPSVTIMFDRAGARAAASEVARRRLELLSASLATQGDGLEPVATDVGAAPEDAVSAPVTARRGGSGRHAARPLPRSARLAAGVSDRVPVPIRAAWATRLSGQHLAVVALLVATALCVAAWWALSARPQAEAMPAMTTGTPVSAPTSAIERTPPLSSPVTAGSPQSEATAGSEQVVVVDVTGRIRRPGIVTLPLGSRVADALEAAGGARSDVDLSTLNLARVLVDGEQLLVGVEAAVPPTPVAATPPVTATPTAGVPGALLDLNTATAEDLDTLPGVGPVTAQAILDWRAEHGGFTSVDELLEVSGIGEVTLEELRPLVTV